MASYYTTVTDVQRELRATTAFSSSTYPSSTTVDQWILEISAQIDQIAGTVFEQTSHTQELLDYNGSEYLLLKNSPVVSVSAFQYNTNTLGETTAWTTLSEDVHYTVYNERGEILFIFSNFSPKDGRKRFRITYSSGYATTPYVVQMLATKMVAQRVLNSLVLNNVNEGNDGGSISVGSISIVEPASYGVNSYKTLQTEIDGLKNELLNGSGVYRYNA